MLSKWGGINLENGSSQSWPASSILSIRWAMPDSVLLTSSTREVGAPLVLVVLEDLERVGLGVLGIGGTELLELEPLEGIGCEGPEVRELEPLELLVL